MSCWVVPTIAAELWGVTLDHVLGRVDEGMVRAKTEHGFLLVDVAPYGEVFHTPRWSGPRPRIQTFTVLPADEYDALHGADAADAADAATVTVSAEEEAAEGRSEPQEEPRHHEIVEEVREEVRDEVPQEVPAVVIEDPELGPDPNDEPDDGRPLRWREGRNRATRMRRRPPGL